MNELRWRVETQLANNKGEKLDLLTRSVKTSFSRTLRDHSPGLFVHRLPQPTSKSNKPSWLGLNSFTYGMLARFALFQIDHWAIIDRFLTAQHKEVHFWLNMRTEDIWTEGDPEITLEPLRWTSNGPRSSPTRQNQLNELGPKYKKKPCVFLNFLASSGSSSNLDTLETVAIPCNHAVCLVSRSRRLHEFQHVGDVNWNLLRHKNKKKTPVQPAGIFR